MKKYFLLFFIFQNSFAFIPGYYQLGVQGIRDVEQPEKGWGIYWYNSLYSSFELNDENGDPVNPKDYTASLDTEINAYTTYPYFFWMPGIEVLGGSLGFSLNLVLGNVEVTSHYPATGETKTGKLLGLGDLNLAPFILAYEWEDFFGIFSLFVGMPIGKFNSEARGNTGLGYWGVIPQISGIYYFGKEDKNALMLNLTFEIKSKVKNSDEIPGDVFSLEAGWNHYFTQKFGLGLSTYYQTHMSHTEGVDPSILGHFGSNAAIGGELNYWLKPGRWGLTFRYNWEYFSKAAHRGSNFVLNLYFNR